MSGLRQDVRYATRGLIKHPGFTAVVVFTLALGIGANAAIFSVVYGVLFRPLPYADADRLVLIEAEMQSGGTRQRTNYSLADLADWQQNAHTFESIAFLQPNIFALASAGGASMVQGAAVSPAFFSTLAAPFVLGRPLGLADDLSPVVVISERLWRQRLAASPTVLGSSITLSSGGVRQSYTVVGVVSTALQFPTPQSDVWMPSGFFTTAVWPDAGGRETRRFNAVARLKEGTTIDQARADATQVARALALAYPQFYDNVTANVVGLHQQLVRPVRPALLVLFAAVALVLLITCANVANLLLVRGASRAKEMAVRRALGASGGRIMMQTIIETILLAAAGTVVATFIAWAGIQTLVWLEPQGLPRLDSVLIDLPVLAFAAAVCVVAAFLSGLLPAIHAARVAPAGVLKTHGSTQSRPPMASRMRRSLVVIQLAVSVVLLVGAALLGRTLANLLRAENIGVQSNGVIAGELNLTMGRTLTDAEQIAVIDRVVESIATIPSIESVGVGNGLPPSGFRMRLELRHRDPSDGVERRFPLGLVPVTGGFFSALGIPLLEGRYFSASDRSGTPSVAILSAGAARTLFGMTEVVGRTLTGPRSSNEKGPIRIVGVVSDVKYMRLDAAPTNAVYRPFAQYPFRNVFLVARSSGRVDTLGAALYRAIAAVDPEITVTSMQPLDEVISDASAQPRFRAAVFMALAGLAFALAVMGLYGLTSYVVAQQTHEIGIRMALGARREQVLRLILLHGVALGAIGVLIGVVGAIATTRYLTSMLFGLTPLDPTTYAGVAIVFIIVMLFASYVPAQRAARIDPLTALRNE